MNRQAYYWLICIGIGIILVCSGFVSADEISGEIPGSDSSDGGVMTAAPADVSSPVYCDTDDNGSATGREPVFIMPAELPSGDMSNSGEPFGREDDTPLSVSSGSFALPDDGSVSWDSEPGESQSTMPAGSIDDSIEFQGTSGDDEAPEEGSFSAVTETADLTSPPDPEVSICDDARSGFLDRTASDERDDLPLSLERSSIPGTKTLAVVEVFSGSSGFTPLVAGTDNENYIFSGSYGSGTIRIKKSGSYQLTDSLTSGAGGGTIGTRTFAIKISAPDVVLDGGYDSATGTVRNGITGNGVPYSDGILITGSGVTIQNFGAITGFTGTGSAGVRGETSAGGLTVSGIISSGNLYGIQSYGSGITVTDSTLSANQNDGIRSTECDATITHNIVSGNGGDGIRSIGSNAVISQNTVTGNENGISSGAAGASITGNTIRENDVGILLPDSKTGITVEGNRVTSNTDAGIMIDAGGGTGSGSITNNYLANLGNVAGGGNPGVFEWSSLPAPGGNVMGGPNTAGNYWSNPEGTGWSDTQPVDPKGYSQTDDYEVIPGSGVYDENPLVRHSTGGAIPGSYSLPSPASVSRPGSNNSVIGLSFEILNATLQKPLIPGKITTLHLVIRETGSPILPAGAVILFVPGSIFAESVGEWSVTTDGKGTINVNLPFLIPEKAGVYECIFTPFLVQTDPRSHEDVRIPAGPPVKFIISIGTDGSVTLVLG